MIPDALDFILRPTQDEQAEYAAAHKTPAPAEEGEAEAGAGTDSSDVGDPASSASEGPRWSSVDDDTADLLSLVANEHPAIPSEADEWTYFVRVLQDVAMTNGLIDQNVTRPLLRGEVKPQRIGAFYHRAAKAGLIRAEGWTTSDDLEGKNSGRPCKAYRWIGGNQQ